ncbi:MAG: hypothetical protein V3S42_04345 [Candidatus Neomarinimicrobiota bacterium]|jgi:hypothetical protein
MEFQNIYEGEYMISKLVDKYYSCYCHFDYELLYPGGTNISLRLIGYNPTKKTHKILHKIDGVNMEDALNKMYNLLYVE